VKQSKTIILAILLVSTQLRARPQIQSEGGTTVVIDVSQDKVIIAADSRETSARGGYRDDDCKIVAFHNQVVFASAGHRLVHATWTTPDGKKTPLIWDSHKVAVDALNAAIRKPPANGDVVSAAAHTWKQSARDYFAKVLQIKPSAVLQLVTHETDTISEMAFVGKDGAGRIVVVEVRVKVNRSVPSIETSSQTIPAGQVGIMGFNSVALEFLRRSTSRAIAEVEKWQDTVTGKSVAERRVMLMTQLVRWSVLYAPPEAEVGGAVDTIVIDSGGIHWIYCKNNCKETE
jgi:hypothetical protein